MNITTGKFSKAGRLARHKGFTLVELMVALAIIVIIAAIALPSYNSYTERSRARTASADLAALSAAMENRFQRQLNYTGATTANVNWTPASAPAHFTFSITNLSANTYTLNATGQGTMGGCNLSLTHTNVRSITGGSACGGLTAW